MNYPAKSHCDPYDIAVMNLSAENKAIRMAIEPGCEVYSEKTHQAGKVVEVIRSYRGVPVCVKVENKGYGFDYIEISNITFYEPYSYESLYTSEDIFDFAEMKISWEEYLDIMDAEADGSLYAWLDEDFDAYEDEEDAV